MKTVTFRGQILSEIHDQLNDEGIKFPSCSELLTELVATLSYFTEEQSVFLPEIVISDDFITLRKVFSETFHVSIGQTKADKNAAKTILKSCGPLTIAGWSIFIDIKGSKLHYGLFRQSWMPFSLSIDDTIHSEGDFPAHFMYIRKSFGNAVLISSPKSESRRILFSNQRDTIEDEQKCLNDLIDLLTAHVNENYDKVQTFLKRTLKQILLKSHGCILTITRVPTEATPKKLGDSVTIDPKLDIARSVQAFSGHEDQTTLSNLQSIPSLMKGMMESDGVVCFSPDAKLLSYRGFARSRKGKGSQAGAVGGARRRAFEALCEDVGDELSGVFMQSSDGTMQIRTK